VRGTGVEGKEEGDNYGEIVEHSRLDCGKLELVHVKVKTANVGKRKPQ